MDINNLKKKVNRLYELDYKLTLEEYNMLLLDCVNAYEMAAVVFIYDHMKNYNIEPTKDTYSIINKLHSKTIKQCNEIYIKNQNVGKLDPRRRIHKIMKGHNYSHNYNNAMVHLDKVKLFLDNNPDVKKYTRIKLAKTISSKCFISFNDARYIITKLKRTHYFEKKDYKIDDFFITSSIAKKNFKQTSIGDYFIV